MARSVWDLRLGGLNLNQTPYYLTDKTELLTWPQPVSSVVTRGNKRALRSGASYSDKCPTMKIQVVVLGDDRSATAEAMRTLHSRLYPTNGGTLVLTDYTNQVTLDKCYLSSEVDVDWGHGNRFATVTFTLTSLDAAWKALRRFTAEGTSTSHSLALSGDAPVPDLEIIFGVSENSAPTLASGATGTSVTLDLTTYDPIPTGSTYFFYINCDSYTAHRISTASWAQVPYPVGQVIPQYLSQSWPGLAVQKWSGLAYDSLSITGCDSWMIRGYDRYSVVA